MTIEKNRKELSALSGLIFFKDLINYLNLEGMTGIILPKRKRQSGMSSGQKFLLGIYRFICGAECIMDLDHLRFEPLFSTIAGTLSSTALGKFLYRFKLKEIEKLQSLLITVALNLRLKLNLDKKIILAMDATSHRQYGKFMEGVKFSGHKGHECLDSQNLFDQYGLCFGSCLYTSKKINRGFLRVVFIRAKKKKLKQEDKRYYDYYAIITSFTQEEKSDENVIKFYRKRANCENFIKDLKYGLDFLHFPCQKLNANRAWGLMGIFAYNLMKYASYLLVPERGCFMKKVRQKMLYIPCEIASHARKLKLRFHEYYFKEVNRLQKLIHINLRLSFNPPVGRGLPAG